MSKHSKKKKVIHEFRSIPPEEIEQNRCKQYEYIKFDKLDEDDRARNA